MFQAYTNFEKHEHNFNVAFATSVAVTVSLLIGGILAALHFFNNPATSVVFFILVIIPLIIYANVSRDTELKTAYYKNWCDRVVGWFDQNKILQQFAKQYQIPSWRFELNEIEVDGRWNFHADTDYMHKLADQRDLLISQIHQNYLNKRSEQNKILIEANRLLTEASIQRETASQNEKDIKVLLEKAKSSGETYRQRREHEKAIANLESCEIAVNDARHHLKSLEQDCENLRNNYESVIYRITKIYYLRYVKYTKTAVKKINKINGLKYSIVDMPSPEKCATNPN